MNQSKRNKRCEQKLLLKIKTKINSDNSKPDIVINDKIDLNQIPLNDIINKNLLNFCGEYFDKLYENARNEELVENNERLSLKRRALSNYSLKKSELFKIDEEEYNEINTLKESRNIKSDNIIYCNIKQKEEKLLNLPTKLNLPFKLNKINFEIKFDTFFGQSISFIGSIDKLGNWNEYKALNMNWNEGNIWKANIEDDNIKCFEYKFIILENGIIKKWEDGINRYFSLTQIKNLFESNLLNGNIIKINNIMEQSIEYNYNDYSLTIISEWNKKTM
jgi:hypothetical protein